jgi:hypothetical protein
VPLILALYLTLQKRVLQPKQLLLSFYWYQLSLLVLILNLVPKEMGRKRCRDTTKSLPDSDLPPRKKRAIIDTPRKNRIIQDVETLQGQVSQREIFRRYGVSRRSGQRIIASKDLRSAQGHSNKRKRLLSEQDLATIETFENASFHHGTQRHFTVAQHLSITEPSERTVQRRMREYGVGTYTAAQRKAMTPERCRMRLDILSGDPCYRTLQYWRRFAYSDEAHFSLGVAKRAKIHRRPGFEARHHPNKMQNRRKRHVQKIHVFGFVFYSDNPEISGKSPLHFYIGTGAKGAMIQPDYEAILRQVVVPNMPTGPSGKVLLEDNHHAHGHKPGSPLRKVKEELGIRWEPNMPTSPDLNVQEKIWRALKQRVKARGTPKSLEELRGWIEQEWDDIDQAMINRYIDQQPLRVIDIIAREGGLLTY